MTKYQPASKCPRCGRPPAIRFSREEVARARRERQSCRVVNVRCTRCRTTWWVQAREIAESRPDARSNGLPDALHPLTRAALRRVNVTSAAELVGLIESGGLSETPGIGPARQREIVEVLDGAASGT